MIPASHVFPNAVLEADHDGTLATVDLGIVRRCSICGAHVHRLNAPDEKSDGSFGSDVYLECCVCHEVWDEDD